MKYITLCFFILFQNISFAEVDLDEQIKKLNWNGIEVVWLEDNRLPVYDIMIYFAEGSLGDKKGLEGTTELMFSQLTSGTNRYTQKQIMELLDFYGASYGSNSTHEYSTFGVSGLIKDCIPTMKMICHLFNQATFPKAELKKTKRRLTSAIESMVTNHGELTNHVFRNESLKGTGYEVPVSGTLKTINNIGAKNLKNRLDDHNKNILKRIYVRGPKSILGLKNIIINDCAWEQGNHIAKAPTINKIKNKGKLIFIDIPEANQAQIRIGRVITTPEVNEDKEELKVFGAKFLGDGFTSELVREIRIKRGLTYSIGAYVSEQKSYGRSGISTFTGVDKQGKSQIVSMLNSIKEVINQASTTIPDARFSQAKRTVKGNYLLELESTSVLLKNLLMHDHIGKDYNKILEFPKVIDKASKSELQKVISDIYDWDKQTIVVLGNKKVEEALKEAGFKFKKVNYKNYL